MEGFFKKKPNSFNHSCFSKIQLACRKCEACPWCPDAHQQQTGSHLQTSLNARDGFPSIPFYYRGG